MKTRFKYVTASGIMLATAGALALGTLAASPAQAGASATGFAHAATSGIDKYLSTSYDGLKNSPYTVTCTQNPTVAYIEKYGYIGNVKVTCHVVFHP